MTIAGIDELKGSFEAAEQSSLVEANENFVGLEDDESSTISVSSQGSEEERDKKWFSLKQRYRKSKYVVAKLKQESRTIKFLSYV